MVRTTKQHALFALNKKGKGVFRGTRRQRGKQRGGGKKTETTKKFGKQFVKEFKGTLNIAKDVYKIGKKKIKQKFQKGGLIVPRRYGLGGLQNPNPRYHDTIFLR